MQRKKYLPSGLATLALVAYLLRGEFNDYLSPSNFPETDEHSVLLGETVGLSGVDILRDADFLAAARIKDVEAYAEEVFRDIRLLAEYPRTRFEIVSAWLVNGTGSAQRPGPEDDAPAAAAPAAGNVSTGAVPNASLAAVDSGGGLASELSDEDMDLIDILWRQDMDMGVGRETYDPALRMEMERERQLELKKQAEKEAAAAEARKKHMMSNFTVDPETGELIPLCLHNGSVSADEKAFETGFWSRSHFASDESCSFSIDELLGENSTTPAAAGGVQPVAGAAVLPDQALYEDLFGLSETVRPSSDAAAGQMSSHSPVAVAVPVLVPAVSCASHGLLVGATADESDVSQILPGQWAGVSSSDWQLQQINASAAAAAAAQAGWLLDGSGCDEPAYDFSVFSGMEDEEADCKGACASMPAVDASLSIFDDVNAMSDLDIDLDNFDMDCLDMAEGKQDVMIDSSPFTCEQDGNSVSSDSAISMDVPSTFEDWTESSPEWNNSEYGAHADVQPSPSDRRSMSAKSRSKRGGPLPRGGTAVQHNHTYTALPGGQPHVRKMDMKKQATNDSMSRDELAAKELGLPFSVDAVVSAPVDEFNAMMRSHVLTEEQLRLVRDIRRRGKNKVAAQNCRRRKLGALVELGESLESLRERRQAMLEQRAVLRQETSVMRSKLAVLYDDLFSSLRTDSGAPYESSRFELRLAGEATRRLLLLPTAPGPGIGAAALREAVASSTALLPTGTGAATGAAASGNTRERHSAAGAGSGSSSSGRARSHASSHK